MRAFAFFIYQRKEVFEVQSFRRLEYTCMIDVKYFDIHWVYAFIGLISSGKGVWVGGVCVNTWSVPALRTSSAHNKWKDFLQKLITAPIQTTNAGIVLDNYFDSGTLNTCLLLPMSLDCPIFPVAFLSAAVKAINDVWVCGFGCLLVYCEGG